MTWTTRTTSLGSSGEPTNWVSTFGWSGLNSSRTLPLSIRRSSSCCALGRAHPSTLAAHLERYSPGVFGLIFTDGKGDPIRRNALGNLWRRAAEPAKVVDRTPHDLRHYAASVLIDQGASVKAVQRHLGHASATTTLDTYAHLWPDAEEVTRKALDAGLADVVSPACHDGAEVEAI